MAEGLDLDETRPRDPRLDELPNPPLRVVFMGTPDFAAVILRRLLGWPGAEVLCVYTQPDRPSGRGREPKPSPVKLTALESNVEVRQPLNFKDQADVAALRALEPDVLVVAAYGLILPQSVLDACRLMPINVHASLLPRWRGAAPIQRAIEAGDAATGVTIMRMVLGLDAGPMLLQRALRILQRLSTHTDVTVEELHDIFECNRIAVLTQAVVHFQRGIQRDTGCLLCADRIVSGGNCHAADAYNVHCVQSQGSEQRGGLDGVRPVSHSCLPFARLLSSDQSCIHVYYYNQVLPLVNRQLSYQLVLLPIDNR